MAPSSVPVGFVPDTPPAALPEGFEPDEESKPDFHTDVKATDSPFHGSMLDSGMADVLIGAAKGAGSTAANLGRLALHAPIVGKFLQFANAHLSGLTPAQQDAAFTVAADAMKATNLGQTLGKGAEQIGEVLMPAGAIEQASVKAVTKLAPRLAPLMGSTVARVLPKVAVEAATGAGLSKAQGGSAISGAVMASAAPVVGEVGGRLRATIAERLQTDAEKKVMQALGPTKERYKAMAAKLTPQIFSRGIRGSREAIKRQTESMLERLGPQVDAELEKFSAQHVSPMAVIESLEGVKAPYIHKVNGKEIVLDDRVVSQITKLQALLAEYGHDMTVGQLVGVRRAWDKVVSQAGGFAQRGPGGIGVPLKDQSEAFAKREATNAIRALVANEVPDLAAINKEFSFWKNLDDVVGQTLKRTQPQKPGLGRLAAEGVGQVVGGMAGAGAGPAGAVGGALFVGKLGALAKTVFESPSWKLADAHLKDQLATAIMKGRVSDIQSVLWRIGAVQGSKLAESQ